MAADFFQWMSRASLFAAVRDSTWAFIVAEMVHLLALAILGGTLLLADLSVLGAGLRGRMAARAGIDLAPLSTGSFITMLLSGALMVAAEPMKCYLHPAFRAKMALIVVAIAFRLSIYRSLVWKDEPTASAKVCAVASIVLLLGICAAGRAIGLI